MRGALDATDRTVTSMLDASHTALSHLQFQDVCAQQLLAVDGVSEKALRQIRERIPAVGLLTIPE